jgi:hypothetical protein
MRPESIVWFERLYLGSLLIGLVQAVVEWEDSIREVPPAVVLAIDAFVFGLGITLTLLVSRKRSNVAKWVNVLLFALYLPLLLYAVVTEPSNVWTPVGFVETSMQATGLGLLFTASARAWLTSKAEQLPSGAALEQTFR